MGERICVMLDDDVDKKLRLVQAKFIAKNQCSCSYSAVINFVLRKNLEGIK